MYSFLYFCLLLKKIDGKEDKDECYIFLRYDTPSRTVEKYVKYFKNEPNLTSIYESLDDMLYHGC